MEAHLVGGPMANMPRILNAGPIMLDLFHRDANVRGQWLRLFPREFAVLWRLAETPFAPVSRRQLLSEVWRVEYEPNSNRVAVAVARIRAKLAPFGLADLVVTDRAAGSYFLATQMTLASA